MPSSIKSVSQRMQERTRNDDVFLFASQLAAAATWTKCVGQFGHSEDALAVQPLAIFSDVQDSRLSSSFSLACVLHRL